MEHFIYNKVQQVTIPSAEVCLNGLLFIPEKAPSLVLFVHGSGSSRLSRRNQYVAQILNEAGLATLLFDLFTPEEELIDEATLQLRFDINFLASRLIDVTNWCRKQSILRSLKIGYFGASTGGGAALLAAALKPEWINAIVSRGGRPDLAKEALQAVQAPSLLIVGGEDKQVIQLNLEALYQLNCTKKMDLIPGATHLFEEPGALAEVAALAKNWFDTYLR